MKSVLSNKTLSHLDAISLSLTLIQISMAPKMDKGKEVMVTGCELLRGGFASCSDEIREVIGLLEVAGLEYVMCEPVPIMQREVLEFYETAKVSSHGSSITSTVAGEEIRVSPRSISIMLQLPRLSKEVAMEEITPEEMAASFAWCGHSGRTQGSIRRFDLNTRGKLIADLVGKVLLCKPGSHDRISKDMFDILCRIIQRKQTDWSSVMFSRIRGSLPNPSFGRILSLFLLNAMGDSINRKMGSSLHYSKKLDYKMIERWSRVIPKSAKEKSILKKQDVAVKCSSSSSSSSSGTHPNPAQTEGEGLLSTTVVELAPKAVPESVVEKEIPESTADKEVISAAVEKEVYAAVAEKEVLESVIEKESLESVVVEEEVAEEKENEGASAAEVGGEEGETTVLSEEEGGASPEGEGDAVSSEEESDSEKGGSVEVEATPAKQHSSATLVYARKKSQDTGKSSGSVPKSEDAVEGEDAQESSALDGLVDKICEAVEREEGLEVAVSKRPREESTPEEGRPKKKVWVTGHPEFLVTAPYGKIMEEGSSSKIIKPVQLSSSLPGIDVAVTGSSPIEAEGDFRVAGDKAPLEEAGKKDHEEVAPAVVTGSLYHLISGLLQEQTKHMEAFVKKEVDALRKELKEEALSLKAETHNQNVQQAHFLLKAGPLLSSIAAHERQNKDFQEELMQTFLGQSNYVHAANQEIVNFMDADKNTILNRLTADKNEVLARMTHDRDEILTRITIETNDLDEHLLDVRNQVQAGNMNMDGKLLIIKNDIHGVFEEVQKGEKEIIEAGAEQAMWTANQLRNALTQPPTRYEIQEPSTGTDEADSDIGGSEVDKKKRRISNPKYLRRRTREINLDPYLGQLSPTSKEIVSNYWINYGYLEDEPGRFYNGQEWNRYKEQELRRWRHKKSFPHGPPPSPKRIPKPLRYFNRQLEKHKQAASASGRGAPSSSGRGAPSSSGRGAPSSSGRGDPSSSGKGDARSSGRGRGR